MVHSDVPRSWNGLARVGWRNREQSNRASRGPLFDGWNSNHSVLKMSSFPECPPFRVSLFLTSSTPPSRHKARLSGAVVFASNGVHSFKRRPPGRFTRLLCFFESRTACSGRLQVPRMLYRQPRPPVADRQDDLRLRDDAVKVLFGLQRVSMVRC